MFGDDSGFDALEDSEGEGDAPEDPPSRLHRRDVPLGVHEDVLQHADDEPDQEEAVRDDVVIVPESEVALLKPPHARLGLLHPPEEERGPDVAAEVGGDEDGQRGVNPVDGGRGGFIDVT